jgi:SAM-dependent methyltransferase
VIQDGRYIGRELELFEKAHHWKSYYGKMLRPYLRGSVLEVGAGIGGTTTALCDPSIANWHCLEPDPLLSAQIQKKIDDGVLPKNVTIGTEYTFQLEQREQFDAILYMDVIEHIEDDYKELQTANQLLKPGGALIVLVPAHQFLYTPFDKKLGHFRRYSKDRLTSAAPSSLDPKILRYLDSVGMSASLANKLFLKSELPTEGQISLWDNWMVPLSRVTDWLTGYNVGKSVLGVWVK